VDPTTGAQTVVSSGEEFADPSGIAVESNGDIVVVDPGAISGAGGVIRVDPGSGDQTIVSWDWMFADPSGIAVGSLFVADKDAFASQCMAGGSGCGGVIRIDGSTQSEVSSGGLFVDPSAIAVFRQPVVSAMPAHTRALLALSLLGAAAFQSAFRMRSPNKGR
jgi:hypothetical protein